MAGRCVVVTGGSGLLGRALVKELEANQDLPVIAMSSRDVDLSDLAATTSFMESHAPKVVYHLAARVSGIMGNLRAQGQGYFENAVMNTNVIEAARRAKVEKIVAMGSAAIYSDVVPLPMKEEDVWLGPPHYSEAGYAHAKRGMLAQLDAYKEQYGMDYAYCISTNLFGPFDKFDEQHGHVIPSLLSKVQRAAHDGGSLTIWGTGSAQRDFLYSKDAAAAMHLIAEKHTGPINLATGVAVSIAQTVSVITDVARFEGDVLWDHSKPDGQKMRDYDTSKLKALGFSPKYDLRSALSETYAWMEENRSNLRR